MAANRLDQFREYMARLDASAGPQETIQEGGYYVPPPGKSVADELARRLSLKPASSHLVLGGIGSGKTTQLALVCKQLHHIEDTRALYLDVSEHCDLRSLSTRDLDVMLARALARLGEKHLQKTDAPYELVVQPVREAAIAYDDYRPQASWNGADNSHHLRAELWSALATLLIELANIRRHVVIVLDSLDRLDDIETFEHMVTTWLPQLVEFNLGVVLTAPLATLYGTRRSLLDRVDRYYHLPWMDVREQESREFLERVLRARIPEALCPDSSRGRLVELSGGVLRDLIALTQSAVEETYVQGEDVITVEQVELVADAFGRKHLLGLNAEDLALLQKVRTAGSFVPTSDEHLALVHTRRVLEYRQGARITYRVHPTIDALLAELAGP
jgi:Cdc6-like AAA superfamily ATPase